MGEKLNISICIPTYNRCEFLKRLLISIDKSQKNNHTIELEIIIQDNASEDGTKEVLSEFSGILNIKYECNELNVGPCENVRRAISRASGDYIWLAGDDDLIEEHSFNIISSVVKNSNVDYIYIRRKLFHDLDGKKWLEDNINWSEAKGIYNSGQLMVDTIGKNIIGKLGFYTSIFVRRELYQKEYAKLESELDEWSHLDVLFAVIKNKKVYILEDALVLCQLGNSRSPNSGIWFDKYIYLAMKQIDNGYSKFAFTGFIIDCINNNQKRFLLDLILGNRTDSISGFLKKNNLQLLRYRKSIYYIAVEYWHLFGFLIRSSFHLVVKVRKSIF